MCTQVSVAEAVNFVKVFFDKLFEPDEQRNRADNISVATGQFLHRTVKTINTTEVNESKRKIKEVNTS